VSGGGAEFDFGTVSERVGVAVAVGVIADVDSIFSVRLFSKNQKINENESELSFSSTIFIESSNE
jgi:hypothetical protein